MGVFVICRMDASGSYRILGMGNNGLMNPFILFKLFIGTINPNHLTTRQKVTRTRASDAVDPKCEME